MSTKTRTAIFSGFGTKRYWKSGTAVEVFKFSVYLIVPVLIATYMGDPDFMRPYFRKFNFVSYPQQGSRLELARMSDNIKVSTEDYPSPVAPRPSAAKASDEPPKHTAVTMKLKLKDE